MEYQAGEIAELAAALLRFTVVDGYCANCGRQSTHDMRDPPCIVGKYEPLAKVEDAT